MRTLVYYPVGTVHMRNLRILARALSDFRFRVFYRTSKPWFGPSQIGRYPYEHVVDRSDRPPASLFDGDVAAVVLSIAAVERGIAELIDLARARRIPVIAIEEVVQVALNQGLVNHYLMPADRVLLASDFEREAFEEAGVPGDRLQVTGWPFFSGLGEAAGEGIAAGIRDSLGIPADRRVVTLCLSKLSALKDPSSLETPDVRRRILEIVSGGLGDGYHLVVKLHPTESRAWVKRHLASFVPDATIAGDEATIADVLRVTDVCLNRGNSQVVFEALLRGIPVLALPCGLRTVFQGAADEAVVNTAGELRDALAALATGRSIDYRALLRRHCPMSPAEAADRTAAAIREIVADPIAQRGLDRDLDLALFWALIGESPRAVAALEREPGALDTPAGQFLGALLHGTAQATDVSRFVQEYATPYQRPAILSLWIRRLSASGATCSGAEWRRVAGDIVFPPILNRHDHVADAVRLGHLFLRSGDVAAARALLGVIGERFAADEGVRMLSAKCDLDGGWLTPRAVPYVAGQIRRTLRESYRSSRRALRGY